MIAAINGNNAIGKDNDLLTKDPADLKHFKEMTLGHTMIMGMKTFESLPNGPLNGRIHIVLTRDKTFTVDHKRVHVYYSIDDLIADIYSHSIPHKHDTVWIVGGGTIYKQFMPLADQLMITHFPTVDEEADTFFPQIVEKDWVTTKHILYPSDLVCSLHIRKGINKYNV